MTGLHPPRFPQPATVLGRFAEQVSRQPDALAVIDPSGNLTYAQLAQASERIARGLLAQGVTPGQAVALALPRGWQWVAAILGLLKAGARVVPLDRASPRDRRERMLADAACAGVLGLDEVTAEPLPPGAWYLGIDAALDQPVQPPLPLPQGVAEVMFLFYTSGSTGTPKAVEVGERGLLRLAEPDGYIEIRPGDRIACLSNPAFDACSFELWAPLLNGGACVIIADHDLLDARRLASALDAGGVDTLFVTVALFNTLAAQWPACFSRQRQVLIGGEQVSAAAVKAWYAANPHSRCQLFNVYGPTECTTFALCYPIPRGFDGDVVPIGWPLPDTGVQVLDAQGHPVPPGQVGELYLSGSGVARGYSLRPDETARAFVQRATPEGGTQVQYRTGDQVSIGADGAVRYVGRLDRQVKVRGFRIEPGEVEQCLEACAGVGQAYVCTQRQAAEDHHLLAFIVPTAAGLDYQAFTAHVRTHLAPCMRPHRVFRLARLPLTANGKVDRAALLAQALTPWHEPSGSAGEHTASLALDRPLGWLLGQARALLSQPALTAQDDWLGSGGDSISAMRLRSAMRDRWQCELPAAALLAEPFAVLAARMESDTGQGEPGYPPAPSVHHARRAPASAEQRRLWLIQQRTPGSTAYNVPLALRLPAEIDLAALAQAVTLLVQREPALRTQFIQGEEGLDQVVAEQGTVCQRLAAGRFTEASWPAFAALVFATPFDLAEPALFQGYLLPLNEGGSVMLWHLHHIVLDGWSMNLLFQGLTALYQAVLSDAAEAAPSDPSRLGTLEFAQWQQQWQATEAYQTQRRALALWHRQQPAPSSALVPLKGDGPAAVLYRQPLGASCSAALERFCAQHRMTRYEVLLAVFTWSLYAVAGTRRPRVASPVANRPLGAFEPVVGMLANTVLVANDLDPLLTLEQQLRRGVAALRQVMAWQDVAFGDLVEDLADEARASSGAPLFDFMFVMENTDYAALGAAGSLGATLAFPATLQAKCPLTLTVVGQGAQLESWWEYQCSYVDAAQVQALDTCLRRGLDQLLTAPQTTLGDLIDPYRRALPPASEGGADVPPFTSIADWFDYQARATPKALALISRTEQVSYARLDALADSLAARLLRQHPLALDDDAPVQVALLLDASVEHVVALLALARLNLTAVPLDPAYPVAVQQQVLAQAQPYCLLYAAATEAALAALGTLPCRCLQVDLSAPAEAFQRRSGGTLRPLYTLFTSGSTGTPKGVQVPHRTLCNLLHWQRGDGRLVAAAATLQFSMLAFDVSFQEVFSTLCGGGCYHLITPHWRQDADALLAYLVEARIERLFLPCVALQHLAQTAVTHGVYPTALREVITAGEQLLCNEALRAWFGGMPQAALFNHYGPTETHVISAWRLAGPARDWPLRAPIGRAVANACLMLVDAHDRPVPAGRRGHLLVAGPMVSECYLNAPELNASRFVRRTGPEGTDRLYYRTGDLAWADDQGCLHYLGRNDQQIKLSGHRLELGQVEAALMQVPGVVNAVVALEGEPPRLTAYLQVDAAFTTVQALDQQVARHLPAQVRIDHYRRLAQWPRTPSGKVNRQALHGTGELMEQGHAAQPLVTATPLERQLSELFTEVIGRAIGLDETFFEAGATSLGLMRLQARYNQAVPVPVTMADLFEQVTVRRLATHLSAPLAPGVQRLPVARPSTAGVQPLAIIGMAINVSGAPDLAGFWDMVRQGRVGIEHFAAQDGLVGARSQLEGMLAFDPDYFGISRQEARLMDPQQRHLLMACVQALEHAAIVPGDGQRIGLIASGGEATYFQQMLRHTAQGDLPDGFQMALHHDKDYLATKAAYHLGLTGPAMSVQAACGGSLIATHLASALLHQGDSDVMLAAGVLIDPTLVDGYRYRPQHIFSRDGLCRPFSEDASGTIGASGYGVVVLKPLAQAQADGDRVYAVLEATALNNDGHDKMSYTAPSVAGQREVIRDALRRAGVRGADIGYVEAHGTGTLLGDPVEAAALRAAFGDAPAGQCGLASVKSQIGHLGAAAGVVGLIRATLAVYHGVVPPNLGFSRLNPQVDLDGSPFYVPTAARAWEGNRRRLAGVSSFGIGGTNAHAIVGQAPVAATVSSPLPVVPCLMVSAHSRSALQRDLDALGAYVAAHPGCQAELLRYLQKGRPPQCWRFAAPHVPGAAWPEAADLRETDLREVVPTGTRVSAADFGPAELVAAWYAGASIDWPGHAAPPPWDLPPSAFDLDDYRFKASAVPAPAESMPPDDTPVRLPVAQWFHQRHWQRVCRLSPTATDDLRPLLVVCATEPVPPVLMRELRALYQRVVQACPGDAGMALGADHYRFDPMDAGAVAQLFDALALPADTMLDWLHALPLSVTGAVSEHTMGAAQWACLDTPSVLMQGWGQRSRQAHLRLWLMSWQACPVDGPVRRPELAALAGPTEVIPQEYPVRCHWVDWPTSHLADQGMALAALLAAPGGLPRRMAVRDGYLWQPRLVPSPLPAGTPSAQALPREGTFLVLGGSGGIGRSLCEYLLRQPGRRVVLLTRSGQVPEALTHYGDRLQALAADLGDLARWPAVLDTLAGHCGALTGVIHAAGVGAGSLIRLRDPVHMAEAVAAKTRGMLALEALIARFAPPTVVYCSSMSALFGGAGHLDYAGTNAVLDGFAHYLSPGSPDCRRLCIDWDIWREVGMAVGASGADAAHQQHLATGLTVEEGCEVFERVMAAGLPQVLVSTTPLEVARRFYPSRHVSVAGPVPAAEDRHKQANGQASGAEPSGDEQGEFLRRRLQACLCQWLGVDSLAEQASLYDLGADSLTLLDLIDELQSATGETFQLSQFSPQVSLGEVLTLVAAARGQVAPTAQDGWASAVLLDPWQAGDGQRWLYLVHPVGGDVQAYRELVSNLDPAIGVCVIADPALRLPDLPPISLHARAGVYLAAIQAHHPVGVAWHVAGWSFGAWVAQALCAQAVEAGSAASGLYLIDPPAPDAGTELSTIDEGSIQRVFQQEFAVRWPGAQEGALPADVQAYLQRLTQCCRHNIASMTCFVPPRLVDTPVHVFIAHRANPYGIGTAWALEPLQAAWAERLPGLEAWQPMDTDHYGIMTGRWIQDIARAISVSAREGVVPGPGRAVGLSALPAGSAPTHPSHR